MGTAESLSKVCSTSLLCYFIVRREGNGSKQFKGATILTGIPLVYEGRLFNDYHIFHADACRASDIRCLGLRIYICLTDLSVEEW